MRYLVRFWLPLLVLALDSSTLCTLVYGQEEEEAAAAEQVKAEVIVEDVVVDVTVDAAAAVEAEAEVLVEEAVVKPAEEEVASQRLEKEIDSKEEAVESALSSLKEKVSTIMDTVKDKSNLVVDKMKNVSPSDAKKIAAGVLGVWGVSVGAGWVAQNINKNNVPPPVFEEKVGRRK